MIKRKRGTNYFFAVEGGKVGIKNISYNETNRQKVHIKIVQCFNSQIIIKAEIEGFLNQFVDLYNQEKETSPRAHANEKTVSSSYDMYQYIKLYKNMKDT